MEDTERQEAEFRPVLLAGAAAGVIFSFRTWSCPACDTCRGRDLRQRFCPRCGVARR